MNHYEQSTPLHSKITVYANLEQFLKFLYIFLISTWSKNVTSNDFCLCIHIPQNIVIYMYMALREARYREDSRWNIVTALNSLFKALVNIVVDRLKIN